MRRVDWISPVLCLAGLLAAPSAQAGTLSAQGNVTLLDDVNQLQVIVGTADFNGGLAPIPFNQYANQGMLFHQGTFDTILPGVAEPGTAGQPFFLDLMDNFFPGPIAGGGVAMVGYNLLGGVVTFTEPITQFGAVASNQAIIHITVWDQNGMMLGQDARLHLRVHRGLLPERRRL